MSDETDINIDIDDAQALKSLLPPEKGLGRVEIQDLFKAMFPFDGFEFENPDRYANPRLILKDPWIFSSQPSFKAIGASDWDYTAAVDKYTNYDGTTGDTDRVFALPASTGRGLLLGVWKVDAGTGDIDVTPDGTDNINGYNAVWKINGQHQFVILQDRGEGEWQVRHCLGTLLEYTNVAQTTIAGATSNVWYNPASHSLSITPGGWLSDYHVIPWAEDTSIIGVLVQATLSTANNAESDLNFTTYGYHYNNHASSTRRVAISLSKHNMPLTIAAAATYYLNILGSGAGALSTLETRGHQGGTYIRARRIA